MYIYIYWNSMTAYWHLHSANTRLDVLGPPPRSWSFPALISFNFGKRASSPSVGASVVPQGSWF